MTTKKRWRCGSGKSEYSIFKSGDLISVFGVSCGRCPVAGCGVALCRVDAVVMWPPMGWLVVVPDK